MAKQIINVGSSANDGTGDPNRTAFQKCNSNFDELYADGGKGTLQQVTDNGNTTTNDITAGGFLSLGNANIPGINFNDAEDLDTSLGFLGADPSITTPRNWVLPDTSGTIALKENTIPLSGTEVDKPITGDLKYGILDGETRKITFKSPDEFDFDLRFGDDGSQLGAQPIIMGFYSTDGTSYGKFGVDSSFNPVIEICNGTNFGYLQFVGNQTLRFYSDNPLCSGIDGFIDYSGNYVSTSFVQKVYVDGLRGKHISKTTTEINAISSPQNGETYFNTTLGTLCFYDGSAWQKVSFTTM